MNYMLPLYLDYLERPSIYEGLFYKELGIIPENGSITEDVVSRIRNKLQEVKLKPSHRPGNMRLKASHKTTVKTSAQIAKDRKIKDLAALNKKTRELNKKGAAVKTAKVKPVVTKAGKGKTVITKVTKTVKPTIKKVAPKAKGALKPFMKKAGMVGAGAAAAYGGYKFYKRYLSKAAKKCQGKSGAEKTLCLKQNARPSYAD